MPRILDDVYSDGKTQCPSLLCASPTSAKFPSAIVARQGWRAHNEPFNMAGDTKYPMTAAASPHQQSASATGSTCTCVACIFHTCERQRQRKLQLPLKGMASYKKMQALHPQTNIVCTYWNKSVEGSALCPRTASFFMCSRICATEVGLEGQWRSDLILQ
eukprot:429718-Pelagomonas_calceolata.AAC.2